MPPAFLHDFDPRLSNHDPQMRQMRLLEGGAHVRWGMAVLGANDGGGEAPHGGPGHATLARLNRLAAWCWYERSVQWQLLAAFVLINLGAGMALGVVALYNAHRATVVEVAATMQLAERLVRGTVDELTREASSAQLAQPSPLHALEKHFRSVWSVRHVRIVVTDARGGRVSEPRADADRNVTGYSEAPRWFRSFFQFGDLRHEVPVRLSGQEPVGTVIVTGQPDDEIAEVWQDLSDLAMVALIVSIIVILLFHLVLRRVLKPLTALGMGLQELEQGRFDFRLTRRPGVKEVAAIVDRFNALAGALDTARADNSRLSQRLVRAHDDERKQIATELHDELGPCVFGLRASLMSLRRRVEKLPSEAAALLLNHVESIVGICERIQTTNRRVLRRFRPVMIGQAAIADVISHLIADFQSHDPEHTFRLDMGRLRESYTEPIDLTIYRCVQEAMTNAARHAEARTISVELEEVTASASEFDGMPTSAVLRLAVADDGRGILPGTPLGLGLTSMQERVHALGGVFAISNPPEGGTRLEVAIPVEGPERCASTVNSDEEQ
jgi:two-component system, NarL family, sensor histidine kinase UhpB